MGRSIVYSAIAFLSGVSALVFENLWFRSAALTLGSGAWSSALVIAAFMAGLASGSAAAGHSDTRPRRPLRAYALVEVAIGITGFAALVLSGSLTAILSPAFSALQSLWMINFVRLFAAFLLLGVPSASMGATLPLLMRALADEEAAFGPSLGGMYGANTAGAVIGALACELALVPDVGMIGAGLIASLLNVTACALALRLDRRATPPAKAADQGLPAPAGYSWPLLVTAFFSGVLFLSFETVFFRFELLFFTSLSTTFAVMLALVLAGIALGGAVGGRFLTGGKTIVFRLTLASFAAGVVLLLCYRWFAGVAQAAVHMGDLRGAFITSLALAFPLAVLSGVMFTLIGDALHSAGWPAARTTALLTTANTAGGAAGALFTGFYLIAAVGLEASFRLLMFGYVAIGGWLIFALGHRGRPHRASLVSGAIACAATVVFFPNGLMRDVYELFPVYPLIQAGERRVAFREGQLETVQLFRADVLGQPDCYRLVVNNHSMAASDVRSRRYMRLFALLPRMLHPAPRKAALIGLGVGVTAKTLTEDTRLDTLDVVEISRDIPAMLKLMYPGPAESPLEDPRVRLHIEDGRFFLQTTKSGYDIITGEPPPPHFAGVANLYSREFFQSVERRLNPGGLVTYWLPVHDLKLAEAQSIARAFIDVFPNGSLWAGSGFDWILMAEKPPVTRVNAQPLENWWRDPVSANELREIGIDDPEALAGLFLAAGGSLRAWAAGAPALTDNFPRRISLDVARDQADFSAFLEVLGSREAVTDFRSSTAMEALWPAEVRGRASEAAFERQARLNTILSVPALRVRQMQALLGDGMPDPLLVKALFWRHAFDFDHVAAILAARPSQSGDDVIEHRAAVAMMDGRFWEAAEWLSGISADRAPRVGAIRMFCLSRGGGSASERPPSPADFFVKEPGKLVP